MYWVDLIGWLGAALLLASRWHVDLMRSKQLYVAAIACVLIFTVDKMAWPIAVASALLLISAVWELRRLKSDHDEPETGFSVIEVGPLDEYLRHNLRIHGRDILYHQPGFVWDGAAPGRHAALVQRGSETIGLLLFHDAPGGVAELELDYVTPRFRNFDPGRHVFFESGFFAERGYQTILTPPNMRGPYYQKLGFEPSGEGFVHPVVRRA